MNSPGAIAASCNIKYKELITSIRNKCAEITISSSGNYEKHFLYSSEESFQELLSKVSEELKFNNDRLLSFKNLTSNFNIPSEWSSVPDGLGTWVAASNLITLSPRTQIKSGDNIILSYIDSSSIREAANKTELQILREFSGEFNFWKILNPKGIKELDIYVSPLSEEGHHLQNHVNHNGFCSGNGWRDWKGNFVFPYQNSDRNSINQNALTSSKIYINDDDIESSFVELSSDEKYSVYKSSFDLNIYQNIESVTFSNKYQGSEGWRGFRYHGNHDLFTTGHNASRNALTLPNFKESKIIKSNIYIFYKY